jgi:hypothetical protein
MSGQIIHLYVLVHCVARPCEDTLTSRDGTGGTRLPGGTCTGPISAVGHGGVFHLIMASPTDRAAVLPCTRTALDRATFLTSVDSDSQYVLIAEGVFPGVDVLSACPATGPHLRVRVHACGARVH